MAAEQLKFTPLHDAQKAAGARLVEFGGWEMPVQYESIIAEHQAVRTAVGLFDVSHMGRVIITGKDAAPFLNHLTVNDVQALEPNQAQYSAMCNENGETIDDILVYRHDSGEILVIVNASNHGKDLAWMQDHMAGFNVSIHDATQETSLIAVQGPKAQEVLAKLTPHNLDDIRYYHFDSGIVSGVGSVISRTGYTGEDGFELMLPSEHAARIWADLLEAGQDVGIKQCGLGARDTLRLEAGLCLYGHELNETTTPLEAGLRWITKFDKGDFIGRDALLAQDQSGLRKKLVGMVLGGRGQVPRQGMDLLHDGQKIGQIASGTLSPTLGNRIATGFVSPEFSRTATEIDVDIRGTHLRTKTTGTRFYKRPQ